MQLRTPRRGRRLVAAVATLGLLGLPLLTSTAADAAASKPKAPAVKVMTRNLYLGADIMRPIQALASVEESPGCEKGTQCYQIKQLDAFANANDVTRNIVDETDFDTRAKLLANELATQKPDLVGMQEVALWRSGEMDSPLGADFLKPNATHVDYDFLTTLLDDVKADGVEYKAISVGKRADVEGPAYQGHILSDATNKRDVRLTMRDVILKRVDSAVKVVKNSEGNKIYKTNLTFNVDATHALKFDRGYQWVDLKDGDYKFRFVNTHLEAFGSDIALAQAQELVDGAGGYDGTTIFTCDCNSDPVNGTIKPGETARHWDPYYLIKRAGGFNDTWTQKYAPQDGFTSGLSETVDDSTDANSDGIEDGFDHRINMVFARTANGDKLKALDGTVVGTQLSDRDATTGLWPSDHGGVVMKLRLR